MNKPLAASPQLVRHCVIAAKLGLTARIVRRYIEGGRWPIPYLSIGVHHLYRECDVEAFMVSGGRWPDRMKWRGQGS